MKRHKRALKFWLLNTFFVPVGIVVLKAFVRSWRVDEKALAELRELLDRNPRMVAAMWHGSLLAIMALARHSRGMGRPVSIMTSPSRDGLLVDRMIAAIGLSSIKGSSRSKPVAATRGMIDAVNRGEIALITLDGPRGPRMVPKMGILLIASAANANIVTVSVGASRALRFRSWDRLFLPLPFARIRLQLHEFHVPEHGTEPHKETIARLADVMIADTKAVGSPIAEEKK
jgi:lysophospholipid acyltransferase (LPLAT)-like uncharacterized protein